MINIGNRNICMTDPGKACVYTHDGTWRSGSLWLPVGDLSNTVRGLWGEMGALHTQPKGEGEAKDPHALFKRAQVPSGQCLKGKSCQDQAAWVLLFLHGCLPNLFVISLSHLTVLLRCSISTCA